MFQAKQAIAAMLLAGIAGGAHAVSASANIDYSTFSFAVIDTDPTDGVTTTLTFDNGSSYAGIWLNNWKSNVFSDSQGTLNPLPAINGSYNAANGGTTALNSGNTLQADANLNFATGGVYQLATDSSKAHSFTLNGPGAVVFRVNYTIGASDSNVGDSFYAYATAGLYGSVNYSDGNDSYFGSNKTQSNGSQNGTLKASFYSDGSSANGYVWAQASARVGQDVAPVPEPSEYLMLLAGLGVVGAAVRRNRR